MSADAFGTLYVCDGDKVQKVTSSGLVSVEWQGFFFCKDVVPDGAEYVAVANNNLTRLTVGNMTPTYLSAATGYQDGLVGMGSAADDMRDVIAVPDGWLIADHEAHRIRKLWK